ncbi:uncharacterized protein LOC143644807 isoform X2 [Tamandua tetradactyla]|uniref:uncharacterized protein LOC143644807 isoform X2 n=1 Tax=Tamandua tetradactyla TaxID=48850 RepID=UPI0040541623
MTCRTQKESHWNQKLKTMNQEQGPVDASHISSKLTEMFQMLVVVFLQSPGSYSMQVPQCSALAVQAASSAPGPAACSASAEETPFKQGKKWMSPRMLKGKPTPRKGNVNLPFEFTSFSGSII